MAYADPPDLSTWRAREEWLQQLEDSYEHPRASYLLSAHGTFLSRDIDLAFCAGAWAAVIILAHSAIDAIIRDTETGDYKSKPSKVFGSDPDLQWLRKTRNLLVHVNKKSAVIDESELHRIEERYAGLERDARRAVELVFRVMYANPGT